MAGSAPNLSESRVLDNIFDQSDIEEDTIISSADDSEYDPESEVTGSSDADSDNEPLTELVRRARLRDNINLNNNNANPRASTPLPNQVRSEADILASLRWTDADRPVQLNQFTGTPGLTTDRVDENSSPGQYYQLFMTDKVFADIAIETNRYATQCGALLSFPPTTSGEVKIYWALSMLMGLVDKPQLYMYWSTDPVLATPIFGSTMTRDRYYALSKYLHFHDNTDPNVQDDKLKKIRSFYDAVTTSFHEVCSPDERVCIDEALIRYFGRLSFKTYNANKPAKYGLKAYKLCDSEGYTYKFSLYTGAVEETGEYKGVARIVMGLMEGYLNQGRKLYMDNWYNSPTLFMWLHDQGTQAAGTLRLTRKGVPAALRAKKKRQKGEIEITAHLVNRVFR